MPDHCKVPTNIALSLLLLLIPSATAQPATDSDSKKPAGQKIIVPGDCVDTANKTITPAPAKPHITPPKKVLHLNVQIEGQTGMFADKSFTFYEPKEISAKEYGKAVNEPSVMANIQSWRQWYGNIFKNIKGKVGSKIPNGFRTKLIVTITPAKQVIVVTEWMNTSKESEERFGIALIDAFKSLPAETLKFPDESHNKSIEIWFFADDSNGFKLANPDHPITAN